MHNCSFNKEVTKINSYIVCVSILIKTKTKSGKTFISEYVREIIQIIKMITKIEWSWEKKTREIYTTSFTHRFLLHNAQGSSVIGFLFFFLEVTYNYNSSKFAM